jgi:hypothetical protein
MNDEDFARQAFAAAFRSGPTGEPSTLPDVERLAFRARRASRQRHGAYAAGTTALAGVVTAGVVTGPALLGLGSPSPSGVSAAAGGSTSASPTPTAKSGLDVAPSPAVACATPPTFDWVAVVNNALPAGAHAVSNHVVDCVDLPDGTRSIQALFTLSTPDVDLQVNVGTGGMYNGKIATRSGGFGFGGTPPVGSAVPLSSATMGPGEVAKLDALKQAARSSASGSLPASELPSVSGSTRLGTGSISGAGKLETSGQPGSAPKDAAIGTCTDPLANETICSATMSKGGFVATDVQYFRTGQSPLMVEVTASTGKNAPTPAAGLQPPLDAAQVTAIAKAVAAHF